MFGSRRSRLLAGAQSRFRCAPASSARHGRRACQCRCNATASFSSQSSRRAVEPKPAAAEPKVAEPKAAAAQSKVVEPKVVEERIVCEPSPEWKKLMMGTLAALEAQANALPALTLTKEAESVGRALSEVQTPKDCAKAIKQFEALRRRAIK